MTARYLHTRILLIAAGWSVIVAGSALAYWHQHRAGIRQLALLEAEEYYQRLYAYRHWNVKIGGVYVPVTAETPPNPFLENVAERDVVTASGRKLTLMNPAYMLRHFLDGSGAGDGKRGHLTSLQPVNPGNAPDAWEREALLRFEQGVPEMIGSREIEGASCLTLMRPLVVEKECLTCHAGQGYRVGDIRGGLSASVPLSPIAALAQHRLIGVTGVHLLVWLAGLLVLRHFSARFQRHLSRSQKLEQTIRRISNYDKLTGLPNQVQFFERLRWALAQVNRREEILAVLCLDLDHFKGVNNAVGHQGGNRLLKEVAERFLLNLRQTDLMARLGGDSFTILLANQQKVADVNAVVCKLLASLAEPFLIDGRELFVTASVGVAIYPEDGEDAETLVKHADVALHRAKQSGRNGYQIYAPGMNALAAERMQLQNDLRKALAGDEFVLHYQPQVDTRSGELLGAEALLRWQHPRLGLLPPNRFIPVAEDSGLIVPIGDWVLRAVCRQIREWGDAGLAKPRISVNLSPRQFQQGDLVARIGEILHDSGVAPACLGLEITESAIMHDADKAVGVLQELRRLGIHIAIDDFGTGYSSLSHLKLFPIDVLKIDRSFVCDLPDDADSVSIVSAIIALARSLNLKVLAEGAETEAQSAMLRGLECPAVQGFLISPPLSPNEFREHLVHSSKPVSAEPETKAFEPLPALS